ncbi:MAG TPA: SpoIIE family protein phosphatase [Candidatus Dormibacteraeota bacterium]|nr:SpoIIE family protein phosphatase [Candidatus Dormibacteraeota bacterium]
METVTTLSLKWSIAHRPMNGAPESGDLCVVQPFPRGILIAVLDGAGHGSAAGAAVQAAAKVLEAHPKELPISLLRMCHDALRNTRGGALSVASIRLAEGFMTWSGVGNGEGVLLRGDPAFRPRSEGLINRPGVVGSRLPALSATMLPIEAGDTLVFTTDGVSHGYAKLVSPGAPPKRTADLILARHGKKSDDALVVVACFREPEP